MKKLASILASVVAAAMALSAWASPLTPQAALNAARTQLKTQQGAAKVADIKNNAATADMSLVYTVSEASVPTLYVFGAPDCSPGFIIAAADDCAMPVVGYSYDNVFDPDNIPPQMQDLLGCFSVEIAAMAADASKAQTSLLARRAPTAGDNRPSIAPICKTQWSQDDPYWNKTPIINGSHTATGCVATAMAQVMKVYDYPTKGIGSHSYTSTWQGYTNNVSFDFGATTFRWDLMLNQYGTNATAAQKDAVATLMYACGVASDMTYGVGGSGTSDAIAGAGLVKYMGYDKSASFQRRNWYTAAQWEQMIYDELSAGRPVMFAGCTSKNEGHEFVCDGYSTNKFFHINWGWSGRGDGYFLLTNLDPDYQGIGGATSNEGFNFEQSIIMGIQPPVEGNDSYVYNLWMNNFAATDTYYPRASFVPMVTTLECYNMSLFAIPGCDLGLRLTSTTDASRTIYFESEHFNNWEVLSGYSVGPALMSGDVPLGEWTLHPVFRLTGSQEWKDLVYDLNSISGYLNVKATDEYVTITAPGQTATKPTSGRMYFNYLNTVPADGMLVRGKSYKINYDILATGACSGKYVCALYDRNTLAVKAYSDIVTITFTAGETRRQVFSMNIAKDLAPGNYVISILGVTADNRVSLIGAQEIPMAVGDAPELKIDFLGADFDTETGIKGNVAYIGKIYDFRYEINSVGVTYDQVVWLLMYNLSTGHIIDGIEQRVTVNNGEKRQYTWSFKIPDAPKASYGFCLAIETSTGDAQVIDDNIVTATVKEDESGIDDVSFSSTEPTLYYNLQGVEVASPQPGGVYIERKGSKVTKRVFTR